MISQERRPEDAVVADQVERERPGRVLARRLASPWTDAVGRTALVLVALQALWRGVVLARGFFTQDDFLMMARADHPLTPDLLFQGYSGHVFPGGFLIFWLQDHHAPLHWPTAVAVVLVLQLLAAVAGWAVLRRVVGPRWIAVLVLAFLLFCPLTLWSTQWWAVAVQFLPVEALLLVAVWALLCRLQDGARWGDPVALLAVVLALAFQERGLLIPVVLAFVAVAHAPGATVRAQVLAGTRRHLVLWGGLVALGLGYLVLHRDLAPIRSTTAGSVSDNALLVANFLFRNVMTGLFGGPWSRAIVGDSMVRPHAWAVVVSALATVALVVWTLRRGTRVTAWAWVLVLVYCVVDVALLFGGRTQMGATYGMLPRYAADVVPAVAVALAVIAADVRVRRPVAPRRERNAVLALVVAYVASAAVSTAYMAPYLYNHEDRRYVETLRAELRQNPQVVLYDGLAPDAIMIGWFGGTGRVSTVIGTAPESPVFDVPSYDLRLVDGRGRLRELNLVGDTRSRTPEDPDCGYHVTSGGVTVPLQRTIRGRKMVLRIPYYTSSTSPMTVETDGRRQEVSMRTGLRRVDLVVGGTISSVRLELAGEGTVCVPGLQVGFPVKARD